MSYSNKIVIVTGASSGIGAAAAVSFAKEGANVVIVGRNEQKLQKVKENCAQTGKEPLVIKADVSNEKDARRIVEDTINKFGKIDVLVNNAGIMKFNGILSDDILEAYDSIMNTNVRGVIYVTHLAAPHLIKTKGNVINISSIVGKMTQAVHPMLCYSVSKAALDHFTRNAAAELAAHGVRVNAISPGPVKTDLLSNAGVAAFPDDMAKDFTALKRVSDAEEIADLILFLASNKAQAITGSDYITDNGSLLI